ncbi:MAG TPA: ABC transporter permease [Bryobacteraceae bacterium]
MSSCRLSVGFCTRQRSSYVFSKRLVLLLPCKRRARELSLEEELRSHVELAAADALKEGVAPDEAMLAGRRDLGNTLLIQEDARTTWGFAPWDHFLQDLRFGVRQCKRQPGFAAVAILTFALGAGANALMFTVVDSVLLRPLPYPDAHQLVSLGSIDAKGSHGSTSLPNFLSLRKYAQSFSGLAVYQEKSVSLRLPGGEPVHAAGVAASANLFNILRVGPMLGRTFLAGEDQPGKSCAVVLSTEFWREYFSSDPRILGQYLTVDGKTCRVSGIMPAHFAFPSRDVGFWMPFQPTSDMAQRGAQFLDVIGRLKPGVTLATAQNEMKVLAQRLEKAFPAENKGKGVGVQLYRDTLTGDIRPALLALLASVAVLLLIACANIANLQLARALGRKREMAIRAALGAGRLRVARQLLTENLMLAFAGSGIGLTLAAGSLDLLKRLGANAIPRVYEIALHPEVCLAMLMVASISAVLFGLAPIWQTARQDIETALRESATSAGGGRRQQQFRDLLVVAQLTLAIVLLAGSGLLLRGLYRLLHSDRGFTAEHVLTLQTAVSGMEPAGKNIAAAIYSPELDAIERIPGVKAAGFITFLPLSNGHATASFLIKGSQDRGLDAKPRVSLNAASDDFFRALRIPLLAGRFFATTDTLANHG